MRKTGYYIVLRVQQRERGYHANRARALQLNYARNDKQKGPESAALLEDGAKLFARADLFGSPLALSECLRQISENTVNHSGEISNASYILSCKEDYYPIYDIVVNVYPNNKF
jgi:hypothetical protein